MADIRLVWVNLSQLTAQQQTVLAGASLGASPDIPDGALTKIKDNLYAGMTNQQAARESIRDMLSFLYHAAEEAGVAKQKTIDQATVISGEATKRAEMRAAWNPDLV